MMASEILTSVFVALGCVIMFLAVLRTRQMLSLLTERKSIRIWRVLFALSIFFIVCYLITLCLVLASKTTLLVSLTGLVFFFGALYVYFAAQISHVTIQELLRTAEERQEAIEVNLRLETELRVARRLQQMALPSETELQAVEGLDIAGFIEPASQVGGDYYDVLQQDEQVKISIGDVTGHGLESGVMMLMTQTAVRTLLESGETDPVRFLTILNRTIYSNVQRMNISKNLTLSLIDYAQGEVRLSGQHEEMIVVRRDGTVELVDTVDLGFPIGLDSDIAGFINQTMVTLHEGDGVVLYTDGITEAENIDGEHYRLDRLCKVLRQNWAQPAEGVKDAVVADVRSFIGEQKIYDDITLLVLKRK